MLSLVAALLPLMGDQWECHRALTAAVHCGNVRQPLLAVLRCCGGASAVLARYCAAASAAQKRVQCHLGTVQHVVRCSKECTLPQHSAPRRQTQTFEIFILAMWAKWEPPPKGGCDHL